jgi:hypothetical protein
MTKKWLVSMLGAAAMTVSAGALAQSPTTGFYIGTEIGNTDVSGADDDIGFKLLGGYRFHPNIAAEVGYGCTTRATSKSPGWNLLPLASSPLPTSSPSSASWASPTSKLTRGSAARTRPS